MLAGAVFWRTVAACYALVNGLEKLCVSKAPKYNDFWAVWFGT